MNHIGSTKLSKTKSIRKSFSTQFLSEDRKLEEEWNDCVKSHSTTEKDIKVGVCCMSKKMNSKPM